MFAAAPIRSRTAAVPAELGALDRALKFGFTDTGEMNGLHGPRRAEFGAISKVKILPTTPTFRRVVAENGEFVAAFDCLSCPRGLGRLGEVWQEGQLLTARHLFLRSSF